MGMYVLLQVWGEMVGGMPRGYLIFDVVSVGLRENIYFPYVFSSCVSILKMSVWNVWTIPWINHLYFGPASGLVYA